MLILGQFAIVGHHFHLSTHLLHLGSRHAAILIAKVNNRNITEQLRNTISGSVDVNIP